MILISGQRMISKVQAIITNSTYLSSAINGSIKPSRSEYNPGLRYERRMKDESLGRFLPIEAKLSQLNP